MGYLGFCITHKVFNHLYNNIEEMKNMTQSSTREVVSEFIGLLDYYCGMWKSFFDVTTFN